MPPSVLGCKQDAISSKMVKQYIVQILLFCDLLIMNNVYNL